MGVSGSGKTTVGELFAAKFAFEFCDADDLHPPANVEKMSRGIPLNDDDRAPWLEAVRNFVAVSLAENKNAVVACSALKEKYRKLLVFSDEVRLIYLKGDCDLISERTALRERHFMKPEMLQSQFFDLEEPDNCLILDVALPLETIVDLIAPEVA